MHFLFDFTSFLLDPKALLVDLTSSLDGWRWGYDALPEHAKEEGPCIKHSRNIMMWDQN